MDKTERGKLVVSAAKSLKRFQLGDARIAAFLYATSRAGRAGLFLSSLRQAQGAGIERVAMLAAAEGFSYPELTTDLLPWCESNGLVLLKRDPKTQRIVSVDSLALSYSGLLAKVADLYDSLDPRPEDIGAILALELASELPRLESEVIQRLAVVIGEQKAQTAVQLAKSYRIVAAKAGRGLPERIVYSERIWTHNIAKAGRALVGLSKEQRELLIALVERVHRYQGIPEGFLRGEAARSGAEHLLEVALGIGLINRTQIQMADGSTRSFLTTPHFFADLEAEFGEDMCDRVKIFLDSTRNGQHFGHPWTGRIADPDALLKKLLNAGVIGPCTAIGTDWVTSERAGIIRVRREDVGSGKCYMELVQRDAVAKVHELITSGTVEPAGGAMEAFHVREGLEFRSIEEARVEAGDVPEPVAEAERAIMLKLREG